MVKIPPPSAGTPTTNPSNTPEEISGMSPVSPPTLSDTLEPGASHKTPPPQAAAPEARQRSQKSSAEEDDTLRDFGFPHGQPKSKETITKFLLAKQERQSPLMHRLRVATGSERAKKINAAFKAAREGTLPALFPAACHNGEMFTVGKVRMSRHDINLTLKLVQTMESVLISILQKELHRAPATASSHHTQKTVTTPDGTQKEIAIRSIKDRVRFEEGRVLTPTEQTTFLHLAQGLPRPQPVPGSTGFRKESFKANLVHLLGARQPVEFHRLRELLPIEESGSLAPLVPGDSTKPEPTFTGLTSKELIKLATALGVFEE